MFDELLTRFENPDQVFGPTPLWWWSGERVTAERLCWQLDRYHEGGVDNLVLINLAPSGPTYGSPADDPPWFSDEWWGLVETVCAHMEPLGMRLWFYDQIGFSGANLQGRITQRNPWARGEKLTAHHLLVANDGSLQVPPKQRLIAVFNEGRRHLGPYGDQPLELAPGTSVLAICASQTAFDYLNPDAFARLLDLVHGEFERRVPQHLGRTIVGSFQDELPGTNAWTHTFPDTFRRSLGYDLVPHLYHLFEGSTAEAQKVRGDYYAVRTRLTEAAVFRPLHAFHERHGLLQGADQSNPARAAYPIQSTQIYTDYFRTHRWINAVGSDHQGDAHAHASLARLHGHDHVWIESFHSSGWGGTLEETWDWLVPFLRAGATIYDPHATYYSTLAGTFEWAPPSTDWRQPYWGQYRQFARAVARTASVLTWGTFQSRVGVLHPTATVQAEVPVDTPIRYFTDMTGEPALPVQLTATDDSQNAYLALCGSTNWFNPLPGLLDAAGIGFDVVDDDSLQKATVDHELLKIGQQHYDTIILPGCRVLEGGTADALLDFLDSGGCVICVGDRPVLAAGLGGDDELVGRLARHSRLLTVVTAQDAVDIAKQGLDLATSDVPLHVRAHGETGVAMVVGAHPMATRWRDHPNRKRIDFDRSRYSRTRQVTIAGSVTYAEVWIPSTGERRRASWTSNGTTSRVTVPLDGAPAGLLVWTTDPDVPSDNEPSSASPEAQASISIQDGWKAELVPTLDNTWGDLSRESDDHLAAVQLWHLTDDLGATIDATFGEQALILSPGTMLPEPLSEATAEAIRRGSVPLARGDEEVITWSGSRGARRTRGTLGNKGEIQPEFAELPNPPRGQYSALRTLVTTDWLGPADLFVCAPSALEVWWDGHRLTSDELGPVRRFPIILTGSASHLLEYRTGPSELRTAVAAETIGTWFTLAERDAMPDLPVFMTAAELRTSDGSVTFSHELTVGDGLRGALLVVGSAAAATIVIDGTVAAQQARVEYYEGGHASPSFFSHELLSSLATGPHTIQIVLETANPEEAVYADLALTYADRLEALPSGTGWKVVSGETTGVSRATRSVWGGLETAHALRRPHPLPRGGWLRGDAALGRQPLPFTCSTTLTQTTSTLRVELPAGTQLVEVPARVDGVLRLEGREYPLGRPPVALSEPLGQRATAELRFPDVVTPRGASLLNGPVFATLQSFDCPLQPWAELGLASWSGGVHYHRSVELPTGQWTLDLGEVRGSAHIELDGNPLADLFCAPFRVDLPVATSGPHELSVTVFNTLAPFLHATTPTVFAFEEQLLSGLLGPVQLVSNHRMTRTG